MKTNSPHEERGAGAHAEGRALRIALRASGLIGAILAIAVTSIYYTPAKQRRVLPNQATSNTRPAVVNETPESTSDGNATIDAIADGLSALANRFCAAAGRDFGELRGGTCDSQTWFWELPASQREHVIEVAFGSFREEIISWTRANIASEPGKLASAGAVSTVLAELAHDERAPFSTLVAIEVTCWSGELRSRFPFEQFLKESDCTFVRLHALECLAAGPRSQDGSWLAGLARDTDAPLGLRRQAIAALARAEGSGELNRFLDGLGDRDLSEVLPGLRGFLADPQSEPSPELWARLMHSRDERTRLFAFESLSDRGVPVAPESAQILFEAAVEDSSRARSLHAELVSEVALDAVATQEDGPSLLQDIASSAQYSPELRIRALVRSTPNEANAAAAVALIAGLDRAADVKAAARLAVGVPSLRGHLRDAMRSWIVRHPNERSALLDGLASSRSELLSIIALEVSL